MSPVSLGILAVDVGFGDVSSGVIDVLENQEQRGWF